MSYLDQIKAGGFDADGLEKTYQDALRKGEDGAFAEAVNVVHAGDPDNLLYAAWYFRLAYAAADKGRAWAIAWGWVIPLAVLNGLILWILSDDQRFMIEMTRYPSGLSYDFMPHIILLWAPISAVFVILYLTLARGKGWGLLVGIAAGLAALAAYTLLLYPQAGPRAFQEQYLTLMAIHLPLAAWTAVGVFLTARAWDSENRFTFLAKSLEIMITGGLFIIAGGIFTGITFGLFQALGIELSTTVQRLFVAGGGGLIPLLVVGIHYNPHLTPAQQSFDEGLSKVIAMLMRILLPLSVLVLLVYVGFIPFNFRQPFENRDVLIIYNGMLFAVMALLLGATPVQMKDLSPGVRTWLRRGIIAVAFLATVVSLYALAAILYRTMQDKLTPNRLTFIGWNIVNIGILLLLLAKQFRAEEDRWLPKLHEAFATGALGYILWILVVILSIPWIFGINQGDVSQLPTSVQNVVYEEAYPILLKCSASPHVYLLEEGQKRWIMDIPTFEDRGFEWRDIEFIPCSDLRSLPDGIPIPEDAGPPPQP